ncbi:MAG TPA: hypothetical protein VFQ65_25120 [Kofleriaceae bacterium]|nr:hypothetical protein [Kofleriaceae bacterium]
MRSILIAIVIAGCGGSTPPPAPPPAAPLARPPVDAAPPASSAADAILAKFNEFADAMCKCTTKECVQDISDQMTAWGTEMAKQPDPKPTDEQAKQLEVIGERLGGCIQKIH